MSYCPECGSEVAPNDVFCAYCGIGLPAVSTQSEVVDSSIENPPTSDLAEIQNSAESVIPEKEALEMNEVDEHPIPQKPFLIDETSGSIKENTNIEDSSEEQISLPILSKEPEEVNLPITTEQDSEIVTPLEDLPTIFEPTVTPPNINIEENEIVSNFSDELIQIQSQKEELKAFSENDLVQNSVTEIEIPIKETSESVAEPSLEEIEEEPKEPRINFDQTIPDSYELPSQVSLIETDTKVSEAEVDEEDKLKSVLDEIDLNLQSQQEKFNERQNELNEEEGVVIPTAANLQQEFVPSQFEDEIISPSASNFVAPLPIEESEKLSDVAVGQQKAEILPNKQYAEENFSNIEPLEENPDIALENNGINITDEPATLLAQEIPVPVGKVAEESVSNPLEVEELEKEARSFTNPNMGEADTNNRNKTKLKPLEEGTVLNGRYEIVRKIGGGGMGAVYLATDKNLGGVLRAVKEMVQSYIEDTQQEKAVNDFKRESLLLTSLEHSSIPTIYDYFFDDKEARFYLVMKYISGGDLAARLRSAPEGRIDEVSITDWAIQIADVLDYLHNRQPPIVYRDLKPSNIMIDGNSGKLMLIDFGIARWVNKKEEKGVTAVGTMGYAPPELFSGNVEPRSDIYSLGSTMFHLLTGADPQSNPLLIFDFNKNPKPRQINSQLSDQMEQILMRAVEYNSTQRFNSAAEMKQALINHMENLKKGTVTFGVVNTSVGSPINANVPVFCGFCGQKIVATDMFCPFCGAQQPLAAQSKKLSQPQQSYASQTLLPRLILFGTNDLESNDYVLEKESNLLGRRDPMSNIFPEVDLSKFDPQTKISRRHARIWREGDMYMLEDLGSSNGTVLISTLNGSIRLLPRQPQVLSHGDKVKLGDTTLRFTIG